VTLSEPFTVTCVGVPAGGGTIEEPAAIAKTDGSSPTFTSPRLPWSC
jgi:hypothetical protein